MMKIVCSSVTLRGGYSLATYLPHRDAKLDLAHPRVEVIPHHEDSVFFGNLARGGTSSIIPPPSLAESFDQALALEEEFPPQEVSSIRP